MGLWDRFSGKPIPRKYIDLILHASTYWATYTPFRAEPIRVGDFGHIDPKTGEFEYLGNIYKDKAVLAEMPELKQDEYQPKQGTSIDKWVIVSKNAHKVEAEVAPNVNVANVAQASIDVEVNFQGSRGAVLAMYRPRTMELPKDILLERLSKIPLLRDKGIYLVSSVVTCPAYAMQVSDQGSTTTKLKFVGQLPVPHAPGVTVGGELRVGWKSENVSSSYQEAHNVEGQYIYLPLYTLKKVWHRPPYRQAHPVKTGDNVWVDVPPPWIPLDDDGNEIIDEDDDEDDD